MIYLNKNGIIVTASQLFVEGHNQVLQVNHRYESINGINYDTYSGMRAITLVKDGVWRVPIIKKYGWQNLYSSSSSENHQNASLTINNSNYSYSKNDTVNGYFNFIYNAYFKGVSAWYGYGIKAYYELVNPIEIKEGIIISDYEQTIPTTHSNGSYNGFSWGLSGLGFNGNTSQSYGDASSIGGIVTTPTYIRENVVPSGMPANIQRTIRESQINNTKLSNICIIYYLYGRYQSTTKITNGNCKIYNLKLLYK